MNLFDGFEFVIDDDLPADEPARRLSGRVVAVRSDTYKLLRDFERAAPAVAEALGKIAGAFARAAQALAAFSKAAKKAMDDEGRGRAEAAASAPSPLDRRVALVAFTDGEWRPVWQEADGRRYVIGGDGERVYGTWHLPPDDDVEPDAVSGS